MCVIDPSTGAGLRSQAAVFRRQQNDTLAVVNNQRVPITQAAGNVATAGQAEWYIRGTPFSIQLAANNRADFITFGSPRAVSATELVYLGDANSVPVYAMASEVQPFRPALEQRRAQSGTELSAMLTADPALRTNIDNLRAVYVPMRAVGCQFQTLNRQEPVRKGGGGGDEG